MNARDNVADARDQQEPTPGNDVVVAATTMLGLLGDPTRLRLMAALLAGESDVTALTEAVGAARPAVSQHLAKLRLAALVTVRREGRRAIYRIGGAHVRRLVTEALCAAEHQTSNRPTHHATPDATPPGRYSGSRRREA